ncbi:MAG TPA: helix-turn-helix domain-containing protein [Candidatus Binatia bacterium]|jgi:cytoskeletal protein RodZ|nr:helix-turn-helix domain-containing protein [Candidatus Binatia bacterium]
MPRPTRYNIRAMSTVAEQLRQAREARHLSVQEVAEIIKIRGDHVRALEEGNFDVFSAPVYIRGFVRTYSTLLKMEVPQVMAALDAELGQTKKFAEPPPLSDHPRGVLDFIMLQLSRVDWRRWVLGLAAVVILLIIVLVYAAWSHHRAADPLKGLKPAVYQPAQRSSGETLPLPKK